jgi:hypothetical protein
MPNAFISSGVSWAPASASGRRRRASTREQPDADEQHQDGDGDHQPLQESVTAHGGLLAFGGFGFWLRQMHGWVEAVNGRQQRLRQAAPARHQVQDGRVLGHAARPERLMLEGGGEEIALQHTRIKRDPAGAGVGQAHGRHPLVFQTPRRERECAHGQCRHQRAEVHVAAQVDAHDARQRLHGAQRRVKVLRGEAGQHDGDRGFAPRRPRTRLVLGARRGLGTVGLIAIASRSAAVLDDAHRLQFGFAVLGRLGRDVQQDQRAGVGVLQLQPRGLDRLAGAQVHRAACALYAQAFAHARRHADADVAVDEHDALLADLQRHRQRHAFPAQDLHRLGGG